MNHEKNPLPTSSRFGRVPAGRLANTAKPLKTAVLTGTIALLLALGAANDALAAGQAANSVDAKIDRMQAQIEALQKELSELKAAQADNAQATVQAQQTAQTAQDTATKVVEKKIADNSKPVIMAGPVSVSLGGFLDFTAAYRDLNTVSDVATAFNTIPYANSPNHDVSEFRPSARGSRITLLAKGPSDGNRSVDAYVEGDFSGAAPTANSGQSNSYTPRLRQAWAAYNNKNAGLYLLAGQAWSLTTLSKNAGMTANSEAIPIGVDQGYVVGFNWTRAPQVRVVKKFSDKVAGGISFEGPQTSVFRGPNAPLTPTITTNPGGPGFAPTSNYSLDIAPDIVAKFGIDTSIGHFEGFGLGRWFRSRIGTENDTVFAGGIGLGAFLPIVPKVLDVSATVMTGKGIGRYGTGQLPDATLKPTGELAPIEQTTAMLGVIGHVSPTVDLFGYFGVERAKREDYTAVSGGRTLAYGYGNSLYDNSGCWTEGAANCMGNTRKLEMAVIGGYWKFYKGEVGTMMAGLQFEHVRKQGFDGIGGTPETSMNALLFTLRYFPFQ
ncbi:hypothetical protein [Lysobacter sp. CA199]|uniref:hypothetical protein n=1 Tax=Lysobacter sp. CA199 TaxID=3455608 RepID=UPI003F8CF962